MQFHALGPNPLLSHPSLLLLLLTFLVSVNATGNYGPNTCLQGWVWREATPTDYVCVTPVTRAQTALDNSHASSRINPTGPYGPYTCINGYVWREAVANDLVCVTPPTRSAAEYDNTQAANRRASLNVTVTPVIYTQSCSDPEGPYTFECNGLGISGDHFNFGSVTVGVFSGSAEEDNGTLIWEQVATTAADVVHVAGFFNVTPPVAKCPGGGAATGNVYARAYDSVSDRWSDPVRSEFLGCTLQ